MTNEGEHGLLKRSCETCDLIAENNQLKLNLVNRGSDLLAIQRVARKFEDENEKLKKAIKSRIGALREAVSRNLELIAEANALKEQSEREEKRLLLYENDIKSAELHRLNYKNQLVECNTTNEQIVSALCRIADAMESR